MNKLPTIVWHKGCSAYRVFEHRFSAKSFNPNSSSDVTDNQQGGRFHPFIDCDGQAVPTMYIADHALGAFAETVMRGDSNSRTLTIDEIELNSLAVIEFEHDLNLVDLGSAKLAGRFDQYTTGDYQSYPLARQLAASIYNQEKSVHGISWMGKQVGIPSLRCMVLFGPRIEACNITLKNEFILSEGYGLGALQNAAMTRNADLPDSYL